MADVSLYWVLFGNEALRIKEICLRQALLTAGRRH